MNVLILSGGNSNERPVSIRSGEAVAKAAANSGFRVTSIDTRNGFDQILANETDVVLPILHGVGGEDGTIQAFLEKHNIPFLGSGSKCSERCFNKATLKAELEEAGINTPNWEIVNADSFSKSYLYNNPFVLKPISGGSSIDTYIVRDRGGIELIPKTIFDRYHNMLLEELITGIEITIGVLGDKTLPVVEIIPPADEEFDYENKYNGKTQEICPSTSLSEKTQLAAQELAFRVHKLMRCQDLSRTDIIVTPDNDLYVLEINTMPGLTNQSLFPKAAKEFGLSMSELAKEFVRLAMKNQE